MYVVLASESLKIIGQKTEEGKTKIYEIIEDFKESAVFLAMVFFALPVAIPLPYPPGFTTIMGIPMMLLSLRMISGSKKVRLPARINNYEIKNSTLKMICNKMVPIVETMEKYIKPRLFFAKSAYCEKFVGFISLMASIAVALPIPLTNAIPALGVAVMTLGLLNKDGYTILIGFLIAIVGMVIAVSAIIASWFAIKYILLNVF